MVKFEAFPRFLITHHYISRYMDCIILAVYLLFSNSISSIFYLFKKGILMHEHRERELAGHINVGKDGGWNVNFWIRL